MQLFVGNIGLTVPRVVGRIVRKFLNRFKGHLFPSVQNFLSDTGSPQFRITADSAADDLLALILSASLQDLIRHNGE